MQRRVIRECHRVLAPGGRLLMCEASADGFEALNALRRECGLTIIPETSTDNISAIRFNEREVDGYVHDVGFRSVAKQGFSQFFIISRVLHPLLVQPLSPRFGAPINALARTIQSHLPLEPGIGSNVLWVLEKP
jgi:SAM-dependent methyltransferase